MTDTTESRALVTREEQYRQIAASNPMGEMGAMLDKMMALAKDPAVDAGKFETIARVVRETREDAQKQQFYQAKASAMLDMPVIDKRGKIVIQGKNGEPDRVQGTYAKWPDLQRAITPVLAAYDLVLSHDVDHEGAIVTVTPVLQHRNGYVERGGQMALPLDTSGGKNNTQGAGSAASYGKRHTSIAILGLRLDDTDDDGWLTATEDEPLNDQQARRVEEAEANWKRGAEVYEQWFQKLEPKDRAWLIQTGRHASITGSEAGRLIAKSVGADPDQAPAKAKAKPKQDGEPDVTTPEGWTTKFKSDLAAATTLDQVSKIEERGATGLKRLSDKHPKLWEQADAALMDAKDRIRSSAIPAETLFEGGAE